MFLNFNFNAVKCFLVQFLTFSCIIELIEPVFRQRILNFKIRTHCIFLLWQWILKEENSLYTSYARNSPGLRNPPQLSYNHSNKSVLNLVSTWMVNLLPWFYWNFCKNEPGGAKGWSNHRFCAPPAYTTQLLTLHQHRANNQYRTANQI